MEGEVEKVKVEDSRPRKSARRLRDDNEAAEALKRMADPEAKDPNSHDGARRRGYGHTAF